MNLTELNENIIPMSTTNSSSTFSPILCLTAGLVIVGIITNCISCVAFSLVRRLRCQVFSPYLIALSISDIVYNIQIGLSVVSILGVPVRSIDLICRASNYALYSSTAASMWLVTVFTLDRFLVVYFPFLRQTRFSMHRSRNIAIYVVISAGMANLWVPIVTGVTTAHLNNTTIQRCGIGKTYEYASDVMHFIDFIVTFSFPVLVLTAFNIALAVWLPKLKRNSCGSAQISAAKKTRSTGSESSLGLRHKKFITALSKDKNSSKEKNLSEEKNLRKNRPFKPQIKMKQNCIEDNKTHIVIACPTPSSSVDDDLQKTGLPKTPRSLCGSSKSEFSAIPELDEINYILLNESNMHGQQNPTDGLARTLSMPTAQNDNSETRNISNSTDETRFSLRSGSHTSALSKLSSRSSQRSLGSRRPSTGHAIRDNMATIMLFAVSTVHLILNLPSYTIRAIRYIEDFIGGTEPLWSQQLDITIDTTVVILLHLQACLNFFLYTATNVEFRRWICRKPKNKNIRPRFS